MFEIYKTFKFDAGHRIFGHFGKCKNLHGHTYEVTFYLKDKVLNDLNVVVDYYNLKPLKEIIDKEFDHSLLISFEDKELIEVAQKLNTKHLLLEHTTSEYLAKYLYERAEEIFKGFISKVEVKETQATGATYYE